LVRPICADRTGISVTNRPAARSVESGAVPGHHRPGTLDALQCGKQLSGIKIRIGNARRGPCKEERVDNFDIKGQRLTALSMLGCLTFNYPILELFNRTGTVLGIPLLYAFIFAAWGLLIALMALVVEAKYRADR
jgi:hypothetical protein